MSGSEPHGHTTEVSQEVSHIPLQIANTCATSLDNPSWHTNVDNCNTTPIASKIYQTQYPCQSIHLQHINIYEIDMNTYDKYI